MPNIFITSDTHYSHKNIVHGVSSWPGKKGTRQFETIDEMNDIIVKNINDTVKEDDILYHLGDWSFGGFDKIQEFRERINCKTIHLILGNHDTNIAKNKNNISNLFTSVAHYREIKIDDQIIVLSHYPMIVWNYHYEKNSPSFMLFGHCHGNLNPKYLGNRKTMDVGIDTHPAFKPYSLEEIKNIMSTRSVKFIDHHDENTKNHDIVEH